MSWCLLKDLGTVSNVAFLVGFGILSGCPMFESVLLIRDFHLFPGGLSHNFPFL